MIGAKAVNILRISKKQCQESTRFWNQHKKNSPNWPILRVSFDARRSFRRKSQRTPSKCLRKTAWMRRKFLKERRTRRWTLLPLLVRNFQRRGHCDVGNAFVLITGWRPWPGCQFYHWNDKRFKIRYWRLRPCTRTGWRSCESDWGFVQRFQHRNRAISPLFQSGSDAWTSMKTMLLRLVPSSIAAASAMQDLGLMTKDWKNQFFDATWKMKSMSDISQLLHDALKDLSDEQRNSALNTIFGTDAMRAAAWMANFTKEQLDQLQSTIENTDAADNARVRMDNLRGSFEQLSGAVDDIFISIGQLLAPAVKIAKQLERSSLRVLLLRYSNGSVKCPNQSRTSQRYSGQPQPPSSLSLELLRFYRSHFRALLRLVRYLLRLRRGFFAAAVIAGGLYLLYQARQTNFLWIRDITIQAFTEIQTRFNRVSAEWLPIITAAMQNIRLAIQYVRNQIRTATKPIVDLLVSFIRDNWETIAAITSTVRQWIVASFQLTFWTLIGFVKAFLQVLGGDWAGARETIKSTVVNARNAIGTMFSTGAEAVKLVLWFFLEAVKLARDMTRTSILGSATLQRNNIVTTWKTLRTSFATTLQWIRTWIKNFAVTTRNAIKEETLWTFGVIIDRIGKAWKEGFEASFTNAIGWLAGIAKSIFNGIIGVIEGFVNNAIDWINKLIEASNRFNPFWKLPTVPKLALWRLAHGGIAGEWFFGWTAIGDGGFVRGAAGIDKVPAMLTAGEVVLNLCTTKQSRPSVERLK